MLQNWTISTGKVCSNPCSLQYLGLQELFPPELSFEGTVCESLASVHSCRRDKWISRLSPKGQGLSQPHR